MPHNQPKRRSPQADRVDQTPLQLSLFQFYEIGHKASLQGPALSIQLSEQFRQQMFREPMRLLAALPRLTVLERRLYWLVLTALKNYQYLQQQTPNSLSLNDQRLSFTFHKSRLRKSDSDKARGAEISVLDIKKTLADLAGKTLSWENEKGDSVTINMFDTQYIVGEGLMVLELNPKLNDAFLKLGHDFAQGTLQKAMSLESRYSQLLYTYFSRYQWRGKWRISVAALKVLLGIKGTGYDRFRNFEAHILKVAEDEINNMKDMNVSYEVFNKNREDAELHFTIQSLAPSVTTRLHEVLEEIKTMTVQQKLQFAASTLIDYYSGFQQWQRDMILSDAGALDRFLRADAYVETGMVNDPTKHESYVAKSVFTGIKPPTSRPHRALTA